MTKTSRELYALEFKHEAVGLVHGGQSIAAACSTGSRPSAKADSRVLTASL